MHRRWLAAVAVVVAAVAALGPAGPAAAGHQDDTLWVTLAINASGGDRITLTDDRLDSAGIDAVAPEAAIALDRPAGSFRVTDGLSGPKVVLDDRLAHRDGRGGLSYALDTGKLQVLAQREGYDSVIVEVCTPRVRQVVNALVAPEADPDGSPGSRCRGWYQQVDDPPIRAVVQLLPDRSRYPWAVGRVVGAAAVTFGLLGIGATLLRRGPLRRRSWVSWLLATGAALAVLPVGWAVATLVLWWTGAVADPMLLGAGPIEEQVARTVLPGLLFVVPALLPAALLLTVPRRERRPPPSLVAAGPPPVTWWPAAWWPQWVAQGAPEAGAAARRRPPPSPAGGPWSASRPPVPPPPPSGWDPPGSTGG